MKSKRILNSALILGFGLLVNAQVVNADETQNVVDSEVVNSSSISNNQVSGGEQTSSDASTIQDSANATLSTQKSETTTERLKFLILTTNNFIRVGIVLMVC